MNARMNCNAVDIARLREAVSYPAQRSDGWRVAIKSRGKAALNRTFKTKAEAVNARDAFERLRDQRSGGSRDAANDMPALLAPSEEEAGPLPVRDVQAGRGGLELLALRRDRGVLL